VEGVRLLGDNASVVHYEDLVSDPAQTLSTLCREIGIPFVESMLDYGGHPAAEGRSGDTIGIHCHRTPSTDSLHKWRQLGDLAQTKHFGAVYLQALGPELIAELGYSYQELQDVVGTPGKHVGSSLVPWHCAIRDSTTWTQQERLKVEWAVAVQRDGALRGSLSFARDNCKALLRSLVPIWLIAIAVVSGSSAQSHVLKERPY
jgi:hypothetical protein